MLKTTEHTLGQIQQCASPTRKKLKGLLLVSLTSVGKYLFAFLGKPTFFLQYLGKM